MKRRFAAVTLMAMLLATPVFAQLIINQTHPVGAFEIKDPSPTNFSDFSQRITVAAQQVIDYSRDTAVLIRVRIVSEVRLGGNWTQEGWYEISTNDAKQLVDAIRGLDAVQARVKSFANAAPDNRARAVYTVENRAASRREFVGLTEQFWVDASAIGMPFMLQGHMAISRLPESERPQAQRQTATQFADLLEKALAYLATN